MSSVHQLAWYPAINSTSIRNRNWLQYRGSLTRRIQEQCTNFQVKPVFQSLAIVHGSERIVLGLRLGEYAMVREVFLYCNKVPVIFAHSVVARKNLRGAWRGLSSLGNKSLGSVLFANPRIKRTPLEFKKLNPRHTLFKRASQKLALKPTSLWARRSLFTLQGQSILVTEIFLPEILNLTS